MTLLSRFGAILLVLAPTGHSLPFYTSGLSPPIVFALGLVPCALSLFSAPLSLKTNTFSRGILESSSVSPSVGSSSSSGLWDNASAFRFNRPSFY